MTPSNAFATFLHSAFYSGLMMIAAMSVVVGLIIWAEARADDTAGGIRTHGYVDAAINSNILPPSIARGSPGHSGSVRPPS